MWYIFAFFYYTVFMRKKTVGNIHGTESDLADIRCGVPQGRILGPLLFLYYVNDMTININ